jgi:hypothetical protein
MMGKVEAIMVALGIVSAGMLVLTAAFSYFVLREADR